MWRLHALMGSAEVLSVCCPVMSWRPVQALTHTHTHPLLGQAQAFAYPQVTILLQMQELGCISESLYLHPFHGRLRQSDRLLESSSLAESYYCGQPYFELLCEVLPESSSS